MNSTTLSKYIIAIFAVLIILAGAFLLNQNPPTTLDEKFTSVEKGSEKYGYIHNGFIFVEQDGGYITRMQIGERVLEIPLHFGPREVEKVIVTGEINGSRFDQGPLYVTFDPNSSEMNYIALAATELTLNLVKGIEREVIAACAFEDPTCEGRPIVTCNSEDKAVIYLKQHNAFEEGNMHLSDNCIVLQGTEWGIVKAVDYFLLRWYRII